MVTVSIRVGVGVGVSVSDRVRGAAKVNIGDSVGIRERVGVRNPRYLLKQPAVLVPPPLNLW